MKLFNDDKKWFGSGESGSINEFSNGLEKWLSTTIPL